MARLIPANWSDVSAYTVGTLALYNGSVYENIVAVAANANGNTIPVGNSSWKFNSIIRIEDFYSLQDAIELALNVDDQEINDSVNMFIQTAEQGINKVLRSPAQRITRTFVVDAESKFSIPGDILDIIHMRKAGDDIGDTLSSRGATVIEYGDKMLYEAMRQDSNDSRFQAGTGAGQQTYPVYWDDSEHFYIAPFYDEGTEIELTYIQNVPNLGTTVLRVNDNYEAINADDETLEEWIDGGNAANTFVQAEDVVLKNLWTLSIPHLLKLGALVAAEAYLKDPARAQMWKQEYLQNLQETQLEFSSYENNRQQSQTMVSGYFY